jgi:Predicted pPIWI-associating nuclease
MVRRVTPAEYQRLMRDAARKQQDAINKYNREVEAYNRNLQRDRQKQVDAINAHNRKVADHNRTVDREHRQAVESYNRAVRAHNARVQANAAQMRSVSARIRSRPTSIQLTPLRDSSLALTDAYERLSERVSQQASDHDDDAVLTLPGAEAANSLRVVDALLAPQTEPEAHPDDLEQTTIGDALRQVSADLDARWRGALFALNPRNPDAARHFCTSAREIIVGILDLKAPDAQVLQAKADCARMKDGKPTRRAKIEHVLRARGLNLTELADFVEADIANVVDLFDVFNSATHGAAGKFGLSQLREIKARVEGGVAFLASLAH